MGQHCEGLRHRKVLTMRVFVVCRAFGETAPELLAEYSVPPVFQQDLLRPLGASSYPLPVTIWSKVTVACKVVSPKVQTPSRQALVYI